MSSTDTGIVQSANSKELQRALKNARKNDVFEADDDSMWRVDTVSPGLRFNGDTSVAEPLMVLLATCLKSGMHVYQGAAVVFLNGCADDYSPFRLEFTRRVARGTEQ